MLKPFPIAVPFSQPDRSVHPPKADTADKTKNHMNLIQFYFLIKFKLATDVVLMLVPIASCLPGLARSSERGCTGGAWQCGNRKPRAHCKGGVSSSCSKAAATTSSSCPSPPTQHELFCNRHYSAVTHTRCSSAAAGCLHAHISAAPPVRTQQWYSRWQRC